MITCWPVDDYRQENDTRRRFQSPSRVILHTRWLKSLRRRSSDSRRGHIVCRRSSGNRDFCSGESPNSVLQYTFASHSLRTVWDFHFSSLVWALFPLWFDWFVVGELLRSNDGKQTRYKMKTNMLNFLISGFLKCFSSTEFWINNLHDLINNLMKSKTWCNIQ